MGGVELSASRRSSRRRLFLLFGVPTFVILGLFIVAMGLMLIFDQKRSRHWVVYQQRTHEAGIRRDAGQADASRRFQAGEMTGEEWRAAVVPISDAWANEMSDAWTAYVEVHPPRVVRMALQITISLAIPALLVLLMLRVLAGIMGARLLGELQRKGYTWMSKEEATWLAAVLRWNAAQIPYADEFHAVPGSAEDVDALVGFVRLRKAVRRGKS